MPRPSQKGLYRRCTEFLRCKRPIRRGEAWDAWARELIALNDAQAWTQLKPPRTRAYFIYEAGLPSEAMLLAYRHALSVLDEGARLGFNPLMLRRLPFTKLAALHAQIGKGDALQGALLNLTRPQQTTPRKRKRSTRGWLNLR